MYGKLGELVHSRVQFGVGRLGSDIRAYLAGRVTCYPTVARNVNSRIATHPRMYEKVKLVLGAVLALVFGASALARRFPNVAWLQRLRFTPPQLTESQRRRMVRRVNINAGIQLILMGIIVPMVYFALTVMFFNEVTMPAVTVVLVSSVACIGLGLTAIVRNSRQ